MTQPRIRCEVPGCGHSRGDRLNDPVVPGMQWICASHWAAVPAKLRKVKARAALRARRLDTSNSWAAFYRIWNRCRRIAIERSAGL